MREDILQCRVHAIPQSLRRIDDNSRQWHPFLLYRTHCLLFCSSSYALPEMRNDFILRAHSRVSFLTELLLGALKPGGRFKERCVKCKGGGNILIENGRRFLTPFVCAGCLLTGWKAALLGPDLPEQAAFHPVSRQLAQTSGKSENVSCSLCTRPEVTPPL